jgi:hypothetical protein
LVSIIVLSLPDFILAQLYYDRAMMYIMAE